MRPEQVRYMAGCDEPIPRLEIGHTVTSVQKTGEVEWDGTVVDVIERGPGGLATRVRVYWRYPLGKVWDHWTSGLRKR